GTPTGQKTCGVEWGRAGPVQNRAEAARARRRWPGAGGLLQRLLLVVALFLSLTLWRFASWRLDFGLGFGSRRRRWHDGRSRDRRRRRRLASHLCWRRRWGGGWPSCSRRRWWRLASQL